MERLSHPARSFTAPIPTSRPTPRRRSISAQTTTADGSSHKGRSLVRGEQLRRYGACIACRRRRTKCDAVKPHCGACVRHHNYLKRTQAGTYEAEDCGCTYDKREGTGSTDASVSEEDEDVVELLEETVIGREKEGKGSRAKGKSKEMKSSSASVSAQAQERVQNPEEEAEDNAMEKEDDIRSWAQDNAIWEETPQSRSSFSSSDTSLWLPAQPPIPPFIAQDRFIPAGLASSAFAVQPWTAQSALPLPSTSQFPTPPSGFYSLAAQSRHGHQALSLPAVPNIPFQTDAQTSAGPPAVPLNQPNLGHRGYQPWDELPAFPESTDPSVLYPDMNTIGPYQPRIPPMFGAHHTSSQFQPSAVLPESLQTGVSASTIDPNQAGQVAGRPLSLPGPVELPPQSNLFYQLHQLFSANNTIGSLAPPLSAQPSSQSEQSQPIPAKEMYRSQTYPQSTSSRLAQAHPLIPVLQSGAGDDDVQDIGISALLRRDNLSVQEYDELLRYMWRDQGGA